jgi:hypothetical protein
MATPRHLAAANLDCGEIVEHALRSVVPPQHEIERTVHMVAVLDRLGAQVAGLGALDLYVMIGAQPFPNRIEVLTRPVELLTQPMEGDPIVAVAEAVIGRRELPTEGLRLSGPRERLLVVEPMTQRLAHGGVA